MMSDAGASDEIPSQISYFSAPSPGHHTGLGLASTIVAALSGLLLLGVFGAGIYAEFMLPGGIDGVSEESLPFTIAVLAALLGYGLACVGIGLGVGGLFQRDRKRTFGVLGVSINGMIVLTLVVLLSIGIVFGL